MAQKKKSKRRRLSSRSAKGRPTQRRPPRRTRATPAKKKTPRSKKRAWTRAQVRIRPETLDLLKAVAAAAPFRGPFLPPGRPLSISTEIEPAGIFRSPAPSPPTPSPPEPSLSPPVSPLPVRPRGRPRKLSPETAQALLDEMAQRRDPDGRPVSITKQAWVLGVDRKTVREYLKKFQKPPKPSA